MFVGICFSTKPITTAPKQALWLAASCYLRYLLKNLMVPVMQRMPPGSKIIQIFIYTNWNRANEYLIKTSFISRLFTHLFLQDSCKTNWFFHFPSAPLGPASIVTAFSTFDSLPHISSPYFYFARSSNGKVL